MGHVVQLIPERSPHAIAHSRQRRVAQPLAGVLQPFAGKERPGITVGKVGKPPAADFRLQGKRQDIVDLFLLPEGHFSACRPIQQLQTVQQRAARHVPITRALVASAVRRHCVQPAVQHPAGPVQQRRQGVPILKPRAGAQHHVGYDPGRPVAQILPADAHPPEIVRFHEGPENPAGDFLLHPAADLGRFRVQPGFQQMPHQGEDHARLRGKQVDVGLFGVRQGIIPGRGSAGNGIHVMGGNHPAAFLADAPDAVDHVVRRGVFICAAAQRRGAQLSPPEKIRPFIRLSAAASHEGQEIRGFSHGIGLVCPGFRHILDFAGIARRKAFPGRSLTRWRKRDDPAGNQQFPEEVPIQIFRKHTSSRADQKPFRERKAFDGNGDAAERISPSSRWWRCLR